jgi:hypothetical protein
VVASPGASGVRGMFGRSKECMKGAGRHHGLHIRLLAATGLLLCRLQLRPQPSTRIDGEDPRRGAAK